MGERQNGNERKDAQSSVRCLGDAHRTRRERAKREVIADAVKTASADLVEVRQEGTPEEQGTWCNFFSVSIREKGCPVVVDTLGGKAGKNEFPAFFCGKGLQERKIVVSLQMDERTWQQVFSATLTKGDKHKFVSFWFYLYKI